MADRDRHVRTIKATAGAYGLAWSPDGTRIAIGADVRSDNVQVVTAEGRELWRATAFDFLVYGLDWSPDGRWVAAGGATGPVAILDAVTGTAVHRIATIQHNGGVAWSPDSGRLAVASGSSDDSATVWVIAASSGAIESALRTETRQIWGVDWSPDGARLVVGGDAVRILDARSGQVLVTVAGQSVAMPGGIRWSPSAERVAVTAARNGICVCDADTGAPRTRFAEGTGVPYAVAFSPDGRVVASGGDHQEMRLWDAETGTELAVMTGHTGVILALAFAPDGRVLASAARDGTVRLWDVSDLCGAPARVSGAGAGPDAAYLVRQLATVGLRPAGAAAPAETPVTEPGAVQNVRAPGYALLAVVAVSSSGVIYKARQQKLNRAVALKTVTRTSSELIERLRHEAEVLARLHHPNVVSVFDDGVFDEPAGQPFFVTEALDGEDLAARLDRAGPLDERTAWLIARQTAGGLAHAAERGVVHRNVKPASLFLVPPRPGFPLPLGAPMVKVTNFGIALVRHEPGDGDRRRAAAGTVAGTAGYMSPEQAAGHDVDLRTDIYSLGVTLYHVLSGRKPFDGGTITDLFLRQRTGPVPRLGAPISEETAALVAAMMATDRNDRPADYAELIARIDALPCVRRAADDAEPGKALVRPGGAGPAKLPALPGALAAVHRAGRYPPLSLLADLLALVAGRPPADPALHALTSAPGVARLAGLRWPGAARPALAALLLAEFPAEPEWTPPPALPPSKLRRELGAALNDSEPGPGAAPTAPARLIASAAARVTPGVAAALVAVGPAACALDPALPLRLAARSAPPARRVPPRRGLSATAGGSAGAGPAAAGGGRAGAANSGPPQAVNPWQWALPPAVLNARARRGELVYRAAPADPPVPARPAVVVLDTSPAAAGTAGGVLRAAAVAVLRSALSAGGAALVSSGGGWSGPVRSEADLACVWSIRGRPGRAGAAEALDRAGRLRAGLGSGAVLVVLAGPWFGWSEPDAAKALAGAGGPLGGRGAFAGPPGWSGRPVLAAGLLRWFAAPADRLAHSDELLALLLA